MICPLGWLYKEYLLIYFYNIPAQRLLIRDIVLIWERISVYS